MSLFNKPKRNIRRRPFNDEEEDNENKSMETEDSQNSKNKVKKKDKPKQTLLSFGEELEEADDGEVFKVKKSSRSRRLMKQLDQERKRKKGEEKLQVDSDPSNMSNMQEKDLEIKTDDLVVKVKNSGPIILNGRDAVTAGKNDYDSEDEADSNQGHRFQRRSDRSENMKFFLESGCIPDAAMIHAARKRRQKARELGHDYIPVEEQSDEKGTSRLVREEDHDHSDDENSQERVNLAVNTDALDKEKRRQAFLDSQVPVMKTSDDECAPEIEEWEVQQIRKGVTGAQIAAAQQDSIMHHVAFGMGPTHMSEAGLPMMMTNMIPAPPPPPCIQPPDPTEDVPVRIEDIVNKLRESLKEFQEIHERHDSNFEAVVEDLEKSEQEYDKGDIIAPEMAQRYRYYQEMRGYVTDLVECLDEKLPMIESLETRWTTLYGDRATELMERRRQDTRDQAEEVTTAARGPIQRRGPEDDARMRRATEREGRRARRRRARELASILPRHMDGMSSDDEVTEQQNLSFRQQKEEIENESREIFADVVDDFSTIKGILSKLEDWKSYDLEYYIETFAPLSIPKMISPIVRLQLLTWNPIMESADLERTKWYSSLLLYSIDARETEESLRNDPDVRLIPSVIEKIVVPKLTTIVEKIWDPMSTSQTLRLVGICGRLVRDYPNLNDCSKQLETLFTAIYDKMQTAVENDVFIPIFPKTIMDPKHQFFQRQFSMAVKLLRNLLSWQGLIGDNKLKNIALGSLLNRYLLAGLRVSPPADALVKANMIMSTLPRAWLQGETIDHLKMFSTLIRQLSEQLDQANPAHNEAWEYSKSILKIIKPL